MALVEFACLLSMSIFYVVSGSETGCPVGITPVTNFDAEEYLGVWYEVAVDEVFAGDFVISIINHTPIILYCIKK